MTLKEFAELEEIGRPTRDVRFWSIANDRVREVAGELEYVLYKDRKAKLLLEFPYNFERQYQRDSEEHDLADLFPSEKAAREALIQRKREQLEEVERVYGRKEKQ